MSDTINRQAAIDVVRKCNVKEVTPAYMLIDKAEIMTELMILPSAEPESHWISCKERLPDLWDYVLCSQINGDVGEGKLLDDECWHICYDQSHRKKSWVVAWQPLPEPYQPKEDES